MTTTYDSSAIEVLTGLEPVRKRPGMYTTTERPNHLAQEVIDNSADEAIAGYCDEIVVTLHADNSLSVSHKGRGLAAAACTAWASPSSTPFRRSCRCGCPATATSTR